MATKSQKKAPIKGKPAGKRPTGKRKPPVKGKSSKGKSSSGRNKPKTNKNSKAKRGKKQTIVGVPTNKREKLVDMEAMRKHDFMSSTEATLTRIFPMTQVEGRRYEVSDKEHCVSTILKLVLDVVETNEMQYDWSLILWNISQQDGLLPEEASVTFTRSFERKDNDLMRKEIMRRRKLSVLSSESEESIKRQSRAVNHDRALMHAIDSGDSVVSFGAEAIITAPDDQTLEKAVNAIKDYLNTNDETRGIKYELDINKQARPFITFGPNSAVGNKDVYVDMTSEDAAITALYVDSGGDRTPGSEYVGVSVGKLIRSHAAYNFQNSSKSLFVGNDTVNKTHTIGGTFDEPSQIYLSKVASRAYLLSGQNVTHFVADDRASVEALMKFPVNENRKKVVDVSKGLLNIMEAIDTRKSAADKTRLLARFPAHMDNIISLFSQFRDKDRISTTDDFANISRDILTDFFVYNKYWSYDARNDISDVRLIGVRHDQFKTLTDFGQYVAQRMKTNKDSRLEEALFELNSIINRTILPSYPALDTHTDPIVDELVNSQFRVIDLTGTSEGAMASVKNPSLNIMMISYLNLILPTLKNGDVIVIHGFNRLSSIATVINDMIASSGLNLDVIYTESNQNNTLKTLESLDSTLDFVIVDLYKNRTDKLVKPFLMDSEWSKRLRASESSYFVRTENSLDYIYLDSIL